MSDDALKAAQAALAAEHAAVYAYGVVGGRIGAARRSEAAAAYAAHRSRRDALARTVDRLDGRPEAAAAAYALPFAVPDSATAARLAAVIEDRIAYVYSDLVRAAGGLAAAGRGGCAAGSRGPRGALAGQRRSLSWARRANVSRRAGGTHCHGGCPWGSHAPCRWRPPAPPHGSNRP